MPSFDYSKVRSYRLNQFSGIDELAIKEGPIHPPARGQVAVRIHAVSLNYRDFIIAAGMYPGPKTTTGGGLIPCSDGAGEVLEVGEGVTLFKAGDRVATTFHENWESGEPPQTTGQRALGGTAQGTLTQIGVYEEGSLVHIPDMLSYQEAATLSCAPLTAWTALRDTVHPIGPESTVLVQGTGGVSIFAAQLALAAGSRVIATSSSDAKLQKYKQLGVQDGDLINYKQTDWVQQVKKIAADGVDHVIEVSGQLKKSLQVIKKGGVVSVIGFVGGNEQVAAMDVLWASCYIRSILVGSRQSFRYMLQAIEHNGIKPVIDRTFEFEQAQEAYRYLESQQHVGKVVINVQRKQ